MKKWPYIIPFLIVGAILMAQTTYNSNRYKQAFYDGTREKTHATFAKFDTASLRFDLAQTRPLITMRGADSSKNWELDGGKLYLKDSLSVGAGSVYFRKWFYNSADTSVGMIFYNTTLARIDTIYGKQHGKDWLVKIKSLITDSLDAQVITDSTKLAADVVTSSKIKDGSIIDADVKATAAIAGTKIAPDFGAQDVVTTGQITTNALAIGTGTKITVIDSIKTAGGLLRWLKITMGTMTSYVPAYNDTTGNW